MAILVGFSKNETKHTQYKLFPEIPYFERHIWLGYKVTWYRKLHKVKIQLLRIMLPKSILLKIFFNAFNGRNPENLPNQLL